MRIGIRKNPWLFYRASTLMQQQVASSAAGMCCEAGVSGKQQFQYGLPESDEAGALWHRMGRSRAERLDADSVGEFSSQPGKHREFLWPPLPGGSESFLGSPGTHFSQGLPGWSAGTCGRPVASGNGFGQDADEVRALLQGGLAGRPVDGQEFSSGSSHFLDPSSLHGPAFPLIMAARSATAHCNEFVLSCVSGGCSIRLPDAEGILTPMEASSVKRKRKKKMNKHKQRKLRRRDRHRK